MSKIIDDDIQQLLELILDNQKQQQQEIENLREFVRTEVNGRLLTVEWLNNNIYEMTKYYTHCLDSLYNRSRVENREIQEWLSNYPSYTFSCEKNIATESNDHLEPESTLEGSTPCPDFVLACERYLKKSSLNALDIGCGSGGVVADFIARKHFAVGLDGSDINYYRDNGYWQLIPHLHTCDITSPFSFKDQKAEQIKFDVISMWEVFEHIPEHLCSGVLNNVHKNLSSNGIFIGSISLLDYVNPVNGTIYHVTLKEKEWWDELFASCGFEVQELPFNHNELCRGTGRNYVDVHDYSKNPSAGFHFFAKKLIQ